MIKLTFAALLLSGSFAQASGGYDNGTPAGKGNWDIDVTINPADIIENGQSYVVWGYGLTEHLDFHGYASHEAGGTDQIYYGLMYNFYSDAYLDLSTAAGPRHRLDKTDIFFPQFLYTIKLPNDYEIIGSFVNVYNVSDNYNRGISRDVALRIPLNFDFAPSYVEDIHFAIGAFSGVGFGDWHPTYSIDFSF